MHMPRCVQRLLMLCCPMTWVNAWLHGKALGTKNLLVGWRIIRSQSGIIQWLLGYAVFTVVSAISPAMHILGAEISGILTQMGLIPGQWPSMVLQQSILHHPDLVLQLQRTLLTGLILHLAYMTLMIRIIQWGCKKLDAAIQQPVRIPIMHNTETP
jgi:hypothetical protein